MSSTTNTARFVGAAFLISNVTFLIGVILVESILGAPDYLVQLSTNQSLVTTGALLEIVNGIAYLGIAVLMYPLFKKLDERLALGYVAIRILEFTMQILSDIGALSLVALSHDFVPTDSVYQTLATLLMADRVMAFQMVSLTFGVSALIFYYLLYQLDLIPKFISVWGLIGAASVLVNLVFNLYGIPIFNLGILMLANELFLGIWLIVKGFNSSANVPE
ncbi:MAG: DUF4386 domain-containing protein [Candidatus Thorarchaeota archaeon]|jgi:hypothetical protein